MPVVTTNRLVARDDTDNPSILKALIALAVITSILLLSIVSFITIRILKRRKAAASSPAKVDTSYRRLTIETLGSFQPQEKRALIDSSSPPTSPVVPEIRITFPDELDRTTGRPQSGRVVVVRMGENASVGLEPLQTDDQLPAYEKIEGIHKFEDLDLERIGGLKELNS